MSKIRQYALEYIADLAVILANNETDEAVLAAARKQFGEADWRYRILGDASSSQKKGGFGDWSDSEEGSTGEGSPSNQTVDKMPSEPKAS